MPRLIFSIVLAAAILHPAAAAENLLVFVGEKISVEEFEPDLGPDVILMDGAFKAKYRVLDVVYGEYSEQTIEFEAYDHYGRPGFEPHKNVLLFVSRDGDRYFHQKYQYFPVFRTLSGVWAGCGSPYAYEPDVHHGSLKPRKLDFGSDAYFDITGLTRRDVRERFPRAHYLLKGGRAYCTEGNPAAELFEVKKQGVLKARGLFKSAANNSFKPNPLRGSA